MKHRPLASTLVLLAACGSGRTVRTTATGDAGARADGTSTGTHPDGSTGTMPGTTDPSACTDTDNDGIDDRFERTIMSDDSDGDGFSDRVEGYGGYPGYGDMDPQLICPAAPHDCDQDGTPNFLDTDSDNDGLTDAEELAARTDPCSADTDGDHVDDLTERVAMSDPRSSSSTPPAGSLYVTLPYHAPGETAEHVHERFPFSTRIHAADVFILVDNSASMDSTIDALRSDLGTVIVPGIRTAIADVRFGVGSFDSMPDGSDGSSGRPGDYTLWIRQKLTNDLVAVQSAFNAMHTISVDTGGNSFGGDNAEDQTEALFETIQGDGSRGHMSDTAAALSVHNALDPRGNGWVPQMNPSADCDRGPDDPEVFGWGCFQVGRVPILVLASDAPWYDGFAGGSPGSAYGHNFSQLVTAINARGGFYIGLDVGGSGSFGGGQTYANSFQLALQTHTLDANRRPVAFQSDGQVSQFARQIADAVTTLAGSTRQDITTRTDPDTTETRIAAPNTTASFLKAVTPAGATPEAPTGYDHSDETTFYNVDPATVVTFDADFYNDFQPGSDTAQAFRATIAVLGRARSVVDRRVVYIIVPASGAQPPG